MLTICGFIEQENWMYARHLNDDSFCSHSSNGGVCEQHHEPEPYQGNHKSEKEEPAAVEADDRGPKFIHVDSKIFGRLASWETGLDIVTAERCQHIIDQQMPDVADQDNFFVWFRRQAKDRQEEIRRKLMTHWHIEAAALKRKKQKERR